MGFLIGHILGGALRPAAVLILSATLGLSFRGRRWGRLVLRLGVIGLLALLVLPIQQWLLLPLENRFPRPPLPGRVDGIIVLGGAIETYISAARGLPSLNADAERMTAAVALARRYPQAKLLFTGGIGTLLPGAETEARVAADLFAQLGVAPDRMTFEGRSRSTWENAVFSRHLVSPGPDTTWLLVTSADHMPRAVGVFRAVGWPVVAWPVAYKSVPGLVPSLLTPLPAKLADIDDALHEWAGLLAYWASGRIATPLPGP